MGKSKKDKPDKQPLPVIVDGKNNEPENTPYLESNAVDQNGLRLHKWDAHLFGCLRYLVPNCLMTLFCPCVTFAQINARLGWSSYHVTILLFTILYVLVVVFYAFGSTLTILISIGITFLIVFLNFRLRRKVRRAFQIPGTDFKDFCQSFWCGCCILAQMATHVGSYKRGDCSFDPPESLRGYERV